MLWKLGKGIALDKIIVVKDSDGVTIVDYDGTEPIAGTVWAGDDQTPVLTLTPTWIDATAGTVAVSIAAEESASLGAGTYGVDVFLADRSADFYRGTLEILASSGTASPPFSYVTYDELATYAAQIGVLLDSLRDQTNFAEQRGRASSDFDRMVMNRYRPVPGRSRRYVLADGVSPGPYAVFAGSPGGSPAPSHATLRGYLGTSAVLVSSDIVEVVAHLALAIIYQGQPGQQNPYREAGTTHQAAAKACFKYTVVEIDSDDDGVPDLRIDQDVTFLT